MIPRDDMIRMAREAGVNTEPDIMVVMERFAAMVEARAAAAEREACAQICDFNSATHPACGKPMTAEELAYAIRARGAA